MRWFVILILGCLLASSVIAVEVKSSGDLFDKGNTVVLTVGGCSARSVLELVDPTGDIIFVGQGFANWTVEYKTSVFLGEGTYMTRVRCEDQSSAETSFCLEVCGEIENNGEAEADGDEVDEDSNVVAQNVTFSLEYDSFENITGYIVYFEELEEYFEVLEENYTAALEENASSDDVEELFSVLDDVGDVAQEMKRDVEDLFDEIEEGEEFEELEQDVQEEIEDEFDDLIGDLDEFIEDVRGVIDGQTGDACEVDEHCAQWSACVAGFQSRGCIDRNECEEERREDRECLCQESWECGADGACIGGQKQRTCRDTNACGSLLQKPAVSIPCAAITTGDIARSGALSGGNAGDLDSFSSEDGFDSFSDDDLGFDDGLGDVDVESERGSVAFAGKSKSTKKEGVNVWLYSGMGLLIVLVSVLGIIVYRKKTAVPSALLDYIVSARGRGVDDGAIENQLRMSGWDAGDITRAMKK